MQRTFWSKCKTLQSMCIRYITVGSLITSASLFCECMHDDEKTQ